MNGLRIRLLNDVKPKLEVASVLGTMRNRRGAKQVGSLIQHPSDWRIGNRFGRQNILSSPPLG